MVWTVAAGRAQSSTGSTAHNHLCPGGNNGGQTRPFWKNGGLCQQLGGTQVTCIVRQEVQRVSRKCATPVNWVTATGNVDAYNIFTLKIALTFKHDYEVIMWIVFKMEVFDSR